MKLTNKYNLPEALARAASAFTRNEPPARRRISVTQLIQPPQIRQLEREHFDDLTEDVMDRMWAVIGSAVHAVIDKGSIPDSLSEEKLTSQWFDWTVVGVPDLLDSQGVLHDWKFVGCRTIQDGIKPEWEQQLNLYALMYAEHGFPITKLQIVAVLRDWMQSALVRARKQGFQYPPQQVMLLDVPMWNKTKAITYLKDRLVLHMQAEDGGSASSHCTDQDRWATKSQWAVMLPKQARAKRLLDSPEQAREYIKTKLPEKQRAGAIYQLRKGRSIRCASFCRVASWCEQWKMLQLQEQEDADVEAETMADSAE